MAPICSLIRPPNCWHFCRALRTALAQALGLGDSTNRLPVVASFAIPTYIAASAVYPSNRPDPTPEQSIRFTRKNDLYRAGVIATYGRLFGTPTDVALYLMDLLLSYGSYKLVGERPMGGTTQRRSEFLVVLMWILGSWTVAFFLSFDTSILQQLVVLVERTLYRTAYVAFVDDLLGVLTRPNVRTLRGKITLIATQAFLISTTVYLFVKWAQTLDGEIASTNLTEASEL